MASKMKNPASALNGRNILLIVSGGIAAYKALELIRLLRADGAGVRCVLTEGGSKFVTPMSLAALSANPVYTDLWSLKDESEMGHIRLSREADLIVVVPASANILAQMAAGLSSDLATTVLLATDKPVLAAPSMNVQMWAHPATQANIQTLRARGIKFAGPENGDMACGETGPGRMAEPQAILESIYAHVAAGPLKGRKALVTAGPTYEALDPVRFIGNRSSGKQGYAIASALAAAGAEVTLVSGPTALPAPPGVKTIAVETAEQMLAASIAALPCDIAICAAAVSDWRPKKAESRKIKKRDDASPPSIALQENPDILKAVCAHKKRPALVAGFAAETENLLANAQGKLKSKGCDWILANTVGGDREVFGGDENHVYLVRSSGHEDWGSNTKTAIAAKLAERIHEHFSGKKNRK